MKKVILFAAVIATVSLVSCKKDRTCTCTTTGNGYTQVDVITVHDVKAGDARSMCLGTQTTTTYTAGSASTTTTGDDTVCELN